VKKRESTLDNTMSVTKNKKTGVKKGTKMSDFQKESIRKSKLGKKRPPRSKEWENKRIESMRAFWKDKKGSEKARKNIGDKNRDRMIGNKYALGSKRSDEFKEKTKQRMIKFYKDHPEEINKSIKHLMEYMKNTPNFSDHLKGEKNCNWKGGTSKYNPDFSRKVRPAILERDNYICQECGEIGDSKRTIDNQGEALDVHHIDGNQKNDNPENLITLHHKCHLKIEQMILTGFKELIEECYEKQFNAPMPKEKKDKIKNKK